MVITSKAIIRYLNELAISEQDSALLVSVGDEVDIAKYIPKIEALIEEVRDLYSAGFHVCRELETLAVKFMELFPLFIES